MLTRRQFLPAAAAGLPTILTRAAVPRRNILFIAIDDLNDWVGVLGGNPQTRTPNLDRLAKQGVLFTNAHCAAPLCNPSRAALMTGIRPATSGVYTNGQPFRQSPVSKNAVTLPMHLRAHGYRVIGSGKIYHGGFPDPPSWDEYWPSQQQNKPPDPQPPNLPANGIPGSGNMDWGPVDNPDEDMGDMKVAEWVSRHLAKRVTEPLFLGCGIFRPHLQWYVPRKYFEMFPVDRIQLPPVKEDDLDDVPPIGLKFARPDGDHKRITSHGKWREAVQAYLASIAFSDAAVGRVLRALETGPNAGDFSIVLWSDHGWHLGEKLHWRKFTLWEEATRNVLMASIPGITRPGGRCRRPVSLLDVYPTLIDVCGLAPRKELEGRSLIAQLKDPAAAREAPALTTYLRGNHSVRDERWRYIRYSDGGEELYDHDRDPQEWTNLAVKPEFQKLKAQLAQWLPKTDAPDSPTARGVDEDAGLGSRREAERQLERRRKRGKAEARP
jgi:arylsulfatase A-like enzyme